MKDTASQKQDRAHHTTRHGARGPRALKSKSAENSEGLILLLHPAPSMPKTILGFSIQIHFSSQKILGAGLPCINVLRTRLGKLAAGLSQLLLTRSSSHFQLYDSKCLRRVEVPLLNSHEKYHLSLELLLSLS